MINIILNGINGKMGRVITQIAAGRNDCRIVAGVDVNPAPLGDIPVYADIFETVEHANVIIDFSHPSALENLLSYAIAKNIPIVIATTGLSNEQIAGVQSASKMIPVFFSANMSIGINLLAGLARKATEILYKDFDIEIVEKHHNQKIDSPSGTALMLANEISDVLPNPPKFEYDRHSKRKQRDKNEIGIHSIRGGTIVGEHEIIFAGRDEVISISHSAMSKDILAVGGINAGVYLSSKKPGLYDMSDLIGR